MLQTFKLNEDELKIYDTEESTKNEEAGSEEDDEFFLAISSSRKLQTGSCPEFYWYPVIPVSAALMSNSLIDSNYQRQKSCTEMGDSLIKRRAKSVNDLSYSTIKSYENITHNNYVQMVNSMINGAISDVADPEYVEYVRRHIQGLFDNYTPVLIKSKSNEEMTINSPSRDKIVEIINQSIPKSYSFDLKLLEETKINNADNYDAMNFAKFGLGIEDSEDVTRHQNEEDKAITEVVESLLEELKIASSKFLETIENTDSESLPMSKNKEKEIDEEEYSKEETNNDSDLNMSENTYEYAYSISVSQPINTEITDARELIPENKNDIFEMTTFENFTEEIKLNGENGASESIQEMRPKLEENFDSNSEDIEKISACLQSLIEKIDIRNVDELYIDQNNSPIDESISLDHNSSIKQEENRQNFSFLSDESTSEITTASTVELNDAVLNKKPSENLFITKSCQNKTLEEKEISTLNSKNIEESEAVNILNCILETIINEEIIVSKLDEIINSVLKEDLWEKTKDSTQHYDNEQKENLNISFSENTSCESTTSTIKLVNESGYYLINEENDKTESTLNLDESATNDLDLDVDTFVLKTNELNSSSTTNGIDVHGILDSIISKALEQTNVQKILLKNEDSPIKKTLDENYKTIQLDSLETSELPLNYYQEENGQIIRDQLALLVENAILQSQKNNLSNQEKFEVDDSSPINLIFSKNDPQEKIISSDLLEENEFSKNINIKDEPRDIFSMQTKQENKAEEFPELENFKTTLPLLDTQELDSGKFHQNCKSSIG